MRERKEAEVSEVFGKKIKYIRFYISCKGFVQGTEFRHPDFVRLVPQSCRHVVDGFDGNLQLLPDPHP